MDEIYQQILTIVSTVIGSVDIVGLIGVVIYAIRQSVANRKAMKLTSAQVEDAFKNAVLPKNIKLDVSSRIEKPIKDGLEEISLLLTDKLKRIDEGERLILSILSLFSHVKQLPEEIQEQIQDYLEPNTTEEVKLD